MRAMPWSSPTIPAAATWICQYMLGSALLVAPIFNPGGEVSYYLPAGEWLNLLTGRSRLAARLARGNTRLSKYAAVGQY